MKNKLWVNLAMLLVSLVLVLPVACQKKIVEVEPGSIAGQDGYTQPAAEKTQPEDVGTDSGAQLQQGASDQTVGLVLQENIYFDFDKYTLTAGSQEILLKNGEWLKNNPDVTITIEGHCDERGTNEYNLALGDRRAQTVRTFLADLGIETARLATVSYGEERPAYQGHGEAAWAKNRRAHFLIK